MFSGVGVLLQLHSVKSCNFGGEYLFFSCNVLGKILHVFGGVVSKYAKQIFACEKEC